MASLPTLQLKEVTLPESKIVCQIGMNYGDKIAIQQVLLGDIKVDMTQKVNVENPEKQSAPENVQAKREISFKTLKDLDEVTLIHCVKAWNIEEPVTLENIYRLGKVDGEFLLKEVKALDQEVSKEDKKK